MEQLLSTLRFDRMTAACAGVVTVRQGDFYGFFGGDGLYAPLRLGGCGLFPGRSGGGQARRQVGLHRPALRTGRALRLGGCWHL